MKETFSGRGNEKKIGLFISKVTNHVTAKIVMDYLMKNTKRNDFIVKDLKSKIVDYRCFQIGAHMNMKDTMYDSSFWPKGVQFLRFNFNFNSQIIRFFRRS